MRILLVEDDAMLADGLRELFAAQGHALDHLAAAEPALVATELTPFDLVVVDIGLPGMDGLELVRRIRARRNKVPILILTARDALEDRVAGLQAGADDYVIKPFDLPELLARLQALLRRARAGQATAAIQCHQLELDPERRRATLAGETLELSGRELDLLQLLVQQIGKVVTKDEIARAWGAEAGEGGAGNTIEVYIHRLRRKLEGSALAIRTVRGLGYLLEEEAGA